MGRTVCSLHIEIRKAKRNKDPVMNDTRAESGSEQDNDAWKVNRGSQAKQVSIGH